MVRTCKGSLPPNIERVITRLKARLPSYQSELRAGCGNHRALCKGGARVIAIARWKEKLQNVIDEHTAAGGTAIAVTFIREGWSLHRRAWQPIRAWEVPASSRALPSSLPWMRSVS